MFKREFKLCLNIKDFSASAEYLMDLSRKLPVLVLNLEIAYLNVKNKSQK